MFEPAHDRALGFYARAVGFPQKLLLANKPRAKAKCC